MKSLPIETIQLLNNQDDLGFEKTFHFFYPRLVYFANEYVSYDIAKNLVQDAFVTFLEKRPTFTHEAQLRSYLYTLVKNNCLMQLRHRKIKSKYIDKTVAANLQNQIHQSALEQLDTSEVTFREMETIIEKTLSLLSPRCRKVFVMSRYEGKKNREIAVSLNISLKAVEAQITSALKIFRVSLQDYLPFIAFLFIYFCQK